MSRLSFDKAKTVVVAMSWMTKLDKAFGDFVRISINHD